MNYQLVYQDPAMPGNFTVRKIRDGQNPLYISSVESNPEYQEYLEWLAEGNEPLPAD